MLPEIRLRLEAQRLLPLRLLVVEVARDAEGEAVAVPGQVDAEPKRTQMVCKSI